MSSGFVSSNALDEERQKRQEEWEKVRKPEDPQTAPEPEVCNKTLFEQLKDNRDAKQAEIEESKKFKNMIRGIDEDESDFLSQVDEMKAQTHIQNKQEEEQVLKEMASKRVITVEAPTLNKVAPVLNSTTKPVSAQANILSAAIKRKATNDKKDSDSEPKIARKDSQVKEAVAASAVIGHIAGLVHYEASRMASKEVAEHYNGVRQEGIGGRTESRIFYQRNLSNWIKSQLIDEVMTSLREERVNNPRVMDLACGKGGDLKKWKIARAKSAVMVDVADVSIKQARERYEENKQREGEAGWFPVQFIVADCCSVNVKEHIKDPRPFDIVSCQFALHYSFINEQSARCFLRNATESLRPGGYFIGTLPDAERIVWAGRQHDGEFVNDVCKVRFENKDELEKPPLFGCKFHFTLDSQVNCPEFLAYFPLLEHLLNEMDMELVLMKRFPDAIQHWQEKGRQLMGRMQALEPFPAPEGTKLSGSEADYRQAQEFVNKLDSEERIKHVGTLSQAEWEAVCMYLVFIFRKRGGETVRKEEAEEFSLKRQPATEEEPTEKRIRLEESQ